MTIGCEKQQIGAMVDGVFFPEENQCYYKLVHFLQLLFGRKSTPLVGLKTQHGSNHVTDAQDRNQQSGEESSQLQDVFSQKKGVLPF